MSNAPCCHHDGNEDKQEGLAADLANDPNIDELDPCCRKELEMRKKAARIKAALDEVDPSLLAVQRHREIIAGAIGEEDLPAAVSGDYPALLRARQAAGAASASSALNGAADLTKTEVDSDSDIDDSDDDGAYDDPEFQRVAAARMDEVRKALEEKAQLRAMGYGAAREVHWRDLDEAIDAAKSAICHFYRPDSQISAQLDLLLERLATEFCGTQFIRCRAPVGSVAAAIAKRHGPSAIVADVLSAYRGAERAATIEVEDELSRGGELEEAAAEQWLRRSGVLSATAPALDEVRRRAGMIHAATSDDEDDGELFDCGLEGCNRRFAHDHVGTSLPAALRYSMH